SLGFMSGTPGSTCDPLCAIEKEPDCPGAVAIFGSLKRSVGAVTTACGFRSSPIARIDRHSPGRIPHPPGYSERGDKRQKDSVRSVRTACSPTSWVCLWRFHSSAANQLWSTVRLPDSEYFG